MKVQETLWLLGVLLCSTRIIKDVDATTPRVKTQSRNLKKGSKTTNAEHVAEHKGGLFGAVPAVAEKAKEKKAAKKKGAKKDDEDENLITSSASLNITTGDIDEDFSALILDRDLPVFSLQFLVSNKVVPSQDGGSLNELEIVTEEYLEKRFDEVFNNTPALHQYTVVKMKPSDDPFIVDVLATSSFQIPGEVPTKEYLIEQAKEAFEIPLIDSNQYDTDFEVYIKDLSLMSDTNPFHGTVDIVFLQRNNDNSPKNDSMDKKTESGISDKMLILFPLLGVLVLLLIVLVGMLWSKKRTHDQRTAQGNKRQLHLEPLQEDTEQDSEIVCSTSSYGEDEEAARSQPLATSNKELHEVSLVDDTVRIGELDQKPSYEAPKYSDEIMCVQEVESEEEEFEEEYDEVTIEDNDADVFIFVKDDPPATTTDDTQRMVEEIRFAAEQEAAQNEHEEQVVEEVTTKDLFSLWEKKHGTDAANNNAVPKQEVNDAQDNAAQKRDLFSFWEQRSGEPKQKEEDIQLEGQEQEEQSSDNLSDLSDVEEDQDSFENDEDLQSPPSIV